MSWTHQFDEDFALEQGLHEAIVYEHIKQWIRHNAANNQDYRNGRYWTYNTKAAWQKQLPFLTIKQVRSALDNLRDSGLILASGLAADAMDRTLWYALSDKALALEGQSTDPVKANPSAPEGQSTIATSPQDKENPPKDVPVAETAPALRKPRKGIERTEEDKRLFGVVRGLILEHGPPWPAPQKENPQVYRLIAWARKAMPDDPEAFLRAFLATAWGLHEGAITNGVRKDREWWAHFAYTPCMLVSLAPQISEYMRKPREDPAMAALKRIQAAKAQGAA